MARERYRDCSRDAARAARGLGDRTQAAERWRITADRWHSARFVWDRQWEQLAALYTELGVVDPARIASVLSRNPETAKSPGRVELGTGAFDEEILLGVGALWMVRTGVRVMRDDHLIVGDQDIAITEEVTHDRGRTGIRILDERVAPAKNTSVRFVRG